MKKWTTEEIDYLINLNIDNIDLYKVAEDLQRSVGSVCSKIKHVLGKDLRNSIIGSKRRAVNHFNLICNRIKTIYRLKNKCYKNTKLLINKEDFIVWFMSNDFKGASVDRIDNNGHYSLDNIQLIKLQDNIRKDKIKAKNGFCECFRCRRIKLIEEFVKDRRRFNGHSTICRECDLNRKKNRSSTGEL